MKPAPGTPRLVEDLRLSGMPVDGTMLSVEITMSQGEHDQVVLRVASNTTISYSTAASKLISFVWGSGGRFCGYVTDVATERKGGRSTRFTQVTAMGPTMVMKRGRPKFFTDMTVGEVARALVAEHKLGFSDEYGTEHYRWRQLAQTDESDWEFLNSLCAREGSALVCSSGVVRLIDPMNVLTRSVPLMFFSSNLSDGNANVYDLEPAHYSDRLPSQFSPTVSYLSNGTSVTVGQNSPVKLPAGFSAARPLLSRREADLAQIRMPVDWEEQASARLQGDSRIEPGTILQVKTSTRTTRSLPYDGYWYVISATHTLNTQSLREPYQTKVDLARITKAPRLPGVSPKQWHLDPRGRPQLVATSTGDWASTWR